ncbi:MAG: hypothetical protein JJ921_11600 [Pseudomonadales bacterium]|nr:hypothetical protein [Pseudomonadales bacterium]MBO7006491.1 hypothetical protein [Pseudomonadales bacterium]
MSNQTISVDQDLAYGEAPVNQVAGFLEKEQAGPDIIGWLFRTLRGQLLRLLFTGTLLGTLIGALLFLMTTSKYESQAIIRIAATQPFIMYEGNSMASRTFDAFVKAQVGMLSSPGLIGSTAEAINILDPDNGVSPIGLSRQISVSESKSVIKITATSDKAERAVLYANTLLDTYLQAQRAQVKERGSYRLRELTNREQELSKRLFLKNEEILALGGEYGLESVVKAHDDKLEMLQNSTRSIDELNRMVLELETFGSATGTGIADDVLLKELVEDHALDLMLFEHSKKLSELAVLELRYQPMSKKVIEMKASIRILEDAMEARRQQIKTLKMSGEIPADAASRQDRIGEIRDKLINLEPQRQALEAEAKDLHAKTIRLQTLEKEAAMLRELLDETQRGLERVKLESRLDVPGSVELVSRAPLPLQPVQDRSRLMGLFGFVVGFAAIVTCFLLKNIISPRVRFTDDLRNFDLDSPLIGQLKSLDDETISGAVDINVYRLRNNIQLSDIPLFDKSRKARVMGVLSDSSGVQSAVLARQLAASFSTAGLKTLRVETNSRDVATSGLAGWRECVINGEKTIRTDLHGPDCMEAGSRDGLKEEQMSLAQVREAVAVLSEDYDVILFDLGEVGRNIASDFVTSQADLTLLVTKPGTPTSALRRAVNHLKELLPNRVRLVMSEMVANDPKFSHA